MPGQAGPDLFNEAYHVHAVHPYLAGTVDPSSVDSVPPVVTITSATADLVNAESVEIRASFADAEWLVISGQVGVNKNGKLANGITRQAEQCYRNILGCLKANGMTNQEANVITQGALAGLNNIGSILKKSYS